MNSFALRLISLTLLSSPFAGAETPAVTISPTSSFVTVGGTRQFTASAAVTWSINNIAGENSTIGTISSTGLYTAPPSLPTPNVLTVKAVTVASSSVSASTSLTVRNPEPQIAGVSPRKLPLGPFNLTVIGSSFVPGS